MRSSCLSFFYFGTLSSVRIQLFILCLKLFRISCSIRVVVQITTLREPSWHRNAEKQTSKEPRIRHVAPQTVVEREEVRAAQATETSQQQSKRQQCQSRAITNGWLSGISTRHSCNATILQHVWARPSTSAWAQHASLRRCSCRTVYGQLPAARLTNTSSNPLCAPNCSRGIAEGAEPHQIHKPPLAAWGTQQAA